MTRVRPSCTLLFATDGLMYDDGQIHAGITDLRRQELEAWIFSEVREKHPVAIS